MPGKTPWLNEGPIRVRWWDQPTGSKLYTELVKETNQPDRNIIMADTAQKRKDASLGDKPRDLSFGRFVGRLPIVDFLRIQKSHPDLFSPDADIARKATIKFFNSTEGAPYRVQRA